MEAYLNAAISGNTENLPNPISRIDFLLCELIKTLGESGASIEEVEKIVTDKVAEIVADAPEDFDTLKELSDWIYTHEESAAAMNTAIQSNTNSIESLLTDVNKKANSDDVYDKTTADSRFLGIDATADKAVADENGSNISETFSAVKNDIAINRTTLGTQCKNFFNPNAVNWYQPTKTSIAKDGTITSTTTSDSRNWGYENAEYFLTLSAGKYIVSTVTETIDNTASNFMNIRGYNESGTQLFNIYPNAIGTKTISFTLTETATIAIMFKLFTQTCKIMIRYADILDDTYEPYKESVDERLIQNKSDIAVNKSTLGTQCKNLLKNNAVTQTINGVTFTINDDKSITVNGTAAAQISFVINNKVGLGIGNYILTGCPSEGSWDTFYLTAYASSAWLSAPDFGSSCKIENKTVTQVVITIASGYTANNLKFYPMLRDADITDGTYEPYKESVDERLIENKSNAAVNRSTLGYQCKNLLKLTLTTTTVSGITFTVNDDYSITLNGTATAIIWLQVGYTKGEHFRKEKLIFTGNPAGTVGGTGLEAWYMNGTTGNKYVSMANGNILTESEYDSSGVIIYEFHINQGRTYNNVTFYPMLRYADISDDTYEPYKENIDERLIENKSNTAVNKSTLGYQCKNLLDWKNATYSTSLRLTQTKTESGISVTSTGSWAVTAYKLPVLEVGTNYIFSTTISDLSVAGGKAYIVISTGTSSSNIVKAAEITNNGTATIKFEATSNTMYVLFYPNYSDTVYTNSFTASNIMLRYADITDGTYEPYQPSLYEQIVALEERIAALEV